MADKEKFYVSTPIYYPNDIPHIGHAYTTLAADVLARWHSLLGKEVFFLTGTDDHGKKIADAAEKAGLSPKEFTDGLVPEFKSAWEKLNIQYTDFIRTTDEDHEALVQQMLQKCFDKGDIYKGQYQGLYCTGCEAYLTEKELEGGNCPIHKKPVESLSEETYFFKLSKYQDKLLEFYEKNPGFLSPKHRSKEIINRVKEGLRDLSISRTSFDWGVPLPFDDKHVTYVWFDALFNYYTATKRAKREGFWPAQVHLIGKDIYWFHAVYWPAFLMSAGLELPEVVYAHGWWTFDKEKISKSVGKVINVDELIAIGGVDPARYFLFRGASFGEDGDFSAEDLIERNNAELANKFGNLVSRVSSLAEKYGFESSSEVIKAPFDEVKKHIDSFALDKALSRVFSFVDSLNEFVQEKKPWETKNKKDLYTALVGVRDATILLYPFIPNACEQIAEHFGFTIDLNDIGSDLKISEVRKAPAFFKKLDYIEREVKPNLNKDEEPEEIMEGVASIEFTDFEKLDLRVGEIQTVEEIEGADKLYKLTVSIGEEVRTICAGIKAYYSHDELRGKKVVVLTNLKPRKLRGIESQGMLLAAGSKEKDFCSLLTPDREVDPGMKIS